MVDYEQTSTPKNTVNADDGEDHQDVSVAVDHIPAGVTLRWSELQLSVPVKEKGSKTITTKRILKGISGAAYPGEFIVIMGPSGAGKSSLLDCLAGRNSSCTGTITVNGQPWSPTVARVSSYVLQDDLFYTSLTVREHLMFQAELRMGKFLTAEHRRKRVDQIIDDLGLAKCRDTLIGGERVRGISGGERKRLSCASELLTNPSILFVDEPTSGLDSFMAETVVLQLQQLAREGRTVVATIHQPSSEIYTLFDKLVLVADGMLMYHGDAATAVEYFASIGYPCPHYTNPSDYFMRQLVTQHGNRQETERLEKMSHDWQQQQNRPHHPEAAPTDEKLELDQLSMQAGELGALAQIAVLCRRNIARLVKDKMAFNARVIQNTVLSVLIGLIFLQLTVDQVGVQNFTGALFFLTVNGVFRDASSEFMIFPLELPIILREHRSGLYRSSSWFIAKNISELPFQIFFPSLALVPVYFMIGFGGTVSTYFTFTLILITLASCAKGIGYMVACVCGRPELSAIIGPVIILPFLLFGGLFLNNESTPVYFEWLKHLSPIKYGFEALMQTFWNTVERIPCDEGDDAVSKCFHTGQDVLAAYDLKNMSVGLNIVTLIALNIGFRVLAAIALSRYLKRNK